MNKTDQLLAKYPIISDQVDTKELRVLLRELEKVLRGGAAGNIVEFGCYVGTTSLFIRRLLDAYRFAGEFNVYDSFAGLPEKTSADNSAAGEQFKAGELLAPRKTFVYNFKKAGLKLPIVDDYANEARPGAARAVDEWLRCNQQFVLRTEASLAIISSCSKT